MQQRNKETIGLSMGDQKMYVKSSRLLVAENDILRDKCDNIVGITNAYPPIASGLCLLASKKASQPVNTTENRNFSHTKRIHPCFHEDIASILSTKTETAGCYCQWRTHHRELESSFLGGKT
jgi:hypothetical protein